jgi:hypothetical protein
MKDALRAAAGHPKPAEEESGLAPSRIGRVQVAGFFSKETSKQLRQLALDTDGTVQSLLTEALNDLFAKHGMPPIADASTPRHVRVSTCAAGKGGEPA